jgi:Tfp pilus assembly protein PilV
MKTQRRSSATAPRSGITLIEVVISIVMLMAGVLVMSGFVMNYTRAVRNAGVEMTAHQLAGERLEQVKSTQRYALIDTLYKGKVETNAAGQTGFTRTTKVTHVGGVGQNEDYRVITIEVKTDKLKKPVTKTTIVAVF